MEPGRPVIELSAVLPCFGEETGDPWRIRVSARSFIEPLN